MKAKKSVPVNRAAAQPPTQTVDDLVVMQLVHTMWPKFPPERGGRDGLARATGDTLRRIEGKQADAIETLIATQMVAAHTAAMEAFAQASAQKHLETVFACLNAANKCSRTFAVLTDTLSRHRGKTSEQKVTVEHVHVHAGGQAIVGNVDRGGGGATSQNEEQCHADAVRSEDTRGSPVPLLANAERTLPYARGQGRSSKGEPERAQARKVHRRGDPQASASGADRTQCEDSSR